MMQFAQEYARATRSRGEFMPTHLMQAQFDQVGTEAPARARWQPGMPIITARDRDEWMAWRHDRALTLQKDRRKRLRRIDYYPSEEADAVIDRLRMPYGGGDASSILNRIVCEWVARQRRSGIE
jgi:hypothetical protein